MEDRENRAVRLDGRHRPGPRMSRAEHVASAIEDEILQARIPVGERLGRRTELIERFAVSPSIMNEALRLLRNQGMVTVRPGVGGGIFVARMPPQIRLGVVDLWFHDSGIHPMELFEARVHLEGALTEVAFARATAEDVSLMRAEVDRIANAPDAKAFINGVMALHRAIVSAAHITVLDAMHQSIVAVLQANISRAAYIDDYQEVHQKSVTVHRDLVEAIATRDRHAFARVMPIHNDALVRADDPRRSPHVGHK